MKYETIYYETIKHIITTEANSKEEAEEKANKYYYDGDGDILKKDKESVDNEISTTTKVE